MGEGRAREARKKPHRAAAPPTRAVRSRRSVKTSSLPAAPVLRGGPPDLGSYWPSPRGQRPRRNGFCGSRVGLFRTDFQFTAEGLLRCRGRRGLGELGLRAGHHEGQAGGGGGEGRAELGPGRQMLHQRNQSQPSPRRRLQAHLLSSCPTRVNNAEGRGPLHSHPIERAQRCRPRMGVEIKKKKKKAEAKARSGGLALWTLAPDSPRTDQRETHGGGWRRKAG